MHEQYRQGQLVGRVGGLCLVLQTCLFRLNETNKNKPSSTVFVIYNTGSWKCPLTMFHFQFTDHDTARGKCGGVLRQIQIHPCTW